MTTDDPGGPVQHFEPAGIVDTPNSICAGGGRDAVVESGRGDRPGGECQEDECATRGRCH